MRKFLSVLVLGLISVSLLWFGFYQPFVKSRAQTVITPPVEDKPPHELAFENTTAIDASGRKMILNKDSIMVLVNKDRNLPSDYVPTDLTVPNVPFPFKEDDPRKQLRSEAAGALEQLFAEARKAGFDLFATSGYRSYAKQASLFSSQVKTVGSEEEANKTVARPGQSEHQTGLAMDVTSPRVKYNLVESFGTTPEGIWLKDNCHRFGFIIRYPQGKEHITGYNYEPWHLRYVGADVAEYIYQKGLTLEEYFQEVYNY